MAGFVFITYSFIPEAYQKEKDFLFTFINLLVLILVFPVTIYNLTQGDQTTGGAKAADFFLGGPLAKILNLIGIDAFSHQNILSFREYDGTLSRVYISQGCSGLYSVGVFIAAFTALVATESRRLDTEFLLLLILGIITAYFANLIRMTIIVAVGHYQGPQALIWTHENIGWVIFLLWISIFWNIILRYGFLEIGNNKD